MLPPFSSSVRPVRPTLRFCCGFKLPTNRPLSTDNGHCSVPCGRTNLKLPFTERLKQLPLPPQPESSRAIALSDGDGHAYFLKRSVGDLYGLVPNCSEPGKVRTADCCKVVGASGFEPPTSWSRTRRSSQAEPRPVLCFLVRF
jgi:hypothetical protein